MEKLSDETKKWMKAYIFSGPYASEEDRKIGEEQLAKIGFVGWTFLPPVPIPPTNSENPCVAPVERS